MRINRMQDESINPQYFAIQDKISELNKSVETIRAEKKYVHKEYNRLRELYVRYSKDIGQLHMEEEELKSNVTVIDTVINRLNTCKIRSHLL